MISNEKPKGGKTGLLVRGTVGVMLLGGTLLLATAARSEPVLPGAEPKKKLTVEEWRKQYPFVSLKDRLEYEAKRAPVTAPPVLSLEAKKRLDDAERNYRAGFRFDERGQALKLLHSQEAAEFIKREGFGGERMPRNPSTRSLHLPAAPTLSPDNVSYPESALEGDPEATLPKTGPGVAGPSRLPTLEALLSLHSNGQYSFLTPNSFGYVKNLNQVAGFEPHQFRYNPGAFMLNQRPPKNKEDKEGKERWVMRRLELVSLLKSDKPAVYVSVQLPRMQDLKDKPRRELSAFEEKALKKLRAGEDLVTEATTNRIHMMGALRASKQCLECHNGQRGELLGSFSYDLLRDPPLRLR